MSLDLLVKLVNANINVTAHGNFPKKMSNNFLIRLSLSKSPSPDVRGTQWQCSLFKLPSPNHANTPIGQHPLFPQLWSIINQCQRSLQKRHLQHVQFNARKKSLAAVGLSDFAPKRKPRRNSGVDKASKIRSHSRNGPFLLLQRISLEDFCFLPQILPVESPLIHTVQ